MAQLEHLITQPMPYLIQSDEFTIAPNPAILDATRNPTGWHHAVNGKANRSNRTNTSAAAAPLGSVGHFLPFNAAKPSHNRQVRGYWGRISSANIGSQGDLWLNTGGASDLSIRLSRRLINSWFASLGITQARGVVGYQFLVLGEVRLSVYGRKSIVVNDLGCIIHQTSLQPEII